jgi:hypothetical protein
MLIRETLKVNELKNLVYGTWGWNCVINDFEKHPSFSYVRRLEEAIVFFTCHLSVFNSKFGFNFCVDLLKKI